MSTSILTWSRWCRSIPRVSALTSTRPALEPLATQGDLSNYTNLVDEPADHALGRSRGGWTTKIHALVDAHCAPLVLSLTAGQAGDNPQLQPLLMRHIDDGARRFRLLADKAYSHDSTRVYLRDHRIAHTIPQRSDQIARRKAKGSHGGRPPGFDPARYRHRNSAERGFNRLKHWRGIATRYDKYALTFLGGATLAAAITYHRVHD
jgi:putative transposase